jgi:hydrogenase maturation protease
MSRGKMGTLILGLGNDILMDDGIGPKLAWFLEKEISVPGIKYETAAIGGMELIEMIRDYENLIIIDAIKTLNGIPGTVYYLTPANFKETLHISHVHDISFLTALELARRLDIKIPASIHIIAVEIIEDLTFGDEFTEPVQKRYPEIKKEVKEMVIELLKT